MNLRFLNNKKRLVFCVSFAVLILLPSVLIPAIRGPLLDTLKHPTKLIMLVRQEIMGIIFYHRNFVWNERLKQELGFLRQKVSNLEDAYLENIRLKNLLSFKRESTYKLIASRVVGRSIDNWSSMVMIDKGKYHGIKDGMIVISYAGLIGRIAETSGFASKIMLINDSSLGVSAMVQRSRQEGLVSGGLGNLLFMRYLPKDADIKVSDKIVTSGLTATYPKGLLIGTVVDIEEEFSGLTQYAVIKPAVELSSIEEVLVIIQ